MGKTKKLFLLLFGLSVLACASLLSAVLYYYYQPAKTKALLEESISGMTGTACSIDDLSYSAWPPKVKAKGVLLVGHVQGFLLQIPELSAGIALRGRFGKKTLTITHLRINGFSFTTPQEMTFEKTREPEEGFPFLRRIFKTLLTSLLFREISIEAMQMSDGHVAAELDSIKITLNGVRGGTTSDQLIEIACEARVEWPSQKFTLVAPEIYLNSEHVIALADPQMKGAFKVLTARFEHPEISSDGFTIESKLIYDREMTTLSFSPMEIQFHELVFRKHRGPGPVPFKGSFLAKAHVDLARQSVIASDFHLLLQNILEMRGGLSLDVAERLQLTLGGLNGHLMPEKVEPFLPETVREPLAPFKITGPVGIHGDAVLLKKKEGEAFDLDVELQLKGNAVSYATPLLSSQASVTGKLHAKGEFPNLRSSLKISCNPISFDSEWVDFAGGSLDLSLEGETLLFQFQNVTLSLPEALVRMGKTDVPLDAVRVELREGSVNLAQGVFNFPEVMLQTSLLKNLLLSVKRDEHETELAVQGRDVHLLESAHALRWIGQEWHFSGQDSLQAGLKLKDNGEWKALSKIDLENSGFQNESLDGAGENISMVLTFDAGGQLERPSASWRTSLQVTKGQILVDRFYLDLDKNGFALTGEGDYDYALKSLHLSSLEMSLKDLLTLNAQGTLSHASDFPVSDLEVSIHKTEAKPLFRHLLLEPFRLEKAFLSTLDVEGSISADLEVRSQRGDLTLKGRCRWDRGSVESLDKTFSVHGVHLDLPLWFHGSGVGEKTGSSVKSRDRSPRRRGTAREEPMTGSLSIRSATFPVLPTQSFVFHLEARPNQLSSPASTLVIVPAGEVQLGPFVLDDPFSPSFSLTTSLRVNHMRLDPILTKTWNRPVEGSLHGTLAPIVISGDELTSKGNIEADFFGGNVSIMNPGAHGIFSITPVIHLDASWKGVLLGELTKETPFGKVEGVLNGHARGLEFAEGEPQKFDLLMETFPQAGIPQTISTKAVDNISQIGGGQSALTGLFASFFKEFPYEKIGIHAILENDLFRLNGTIKEDGKEYFVKRGGFSGVNVVNQNPDNLISFKDMVKRVKRVATSGREAVVE